MRRTVALAVPLLAAQLAGCPLSDRAVHQRRRAADLSPAALEPTPTEGGTIGPLRVREHLDQGYRAQNPDAGAKIRLLLERANRVLEPTAGVRLELAEIRPWERRSGASGDNQAALEELERTDTGENVHLVIGMLDALSQVSLDQHELGRAHLVGRHLVVRGLDDGDEVAAMERGLTTLTRGDRQRLYSARKRHKEISLLLHEVGHTLGGLHVTGESDILNPRYDHRVAEFGRDNALLMRAVARAVLARESEARGQWRAALDLVRRNRSSAWNEDEKANLVTVLGQRAEGTDAEVAAEKLGSGVRASDRERFRAAERLLAEGRALDAWEELEPLLDFYPEEAAIHRLACKLVVAAERDRASIEALCGRAVAAAPADAEPHLRLAQNYHGAGDQDRSLAATRKAMQLLEGAAADERSDRLWGEMAAHLQSIGAVTWAEQAAARTKRAAEVTEWARLTRARSGLAPGAMPPEREAVYVAGVRELMSAVYERRYREVEAKAAALRRSYRRGAGIDAALCYLEVLRRRYPAARARCREALRQHEGTSWAHYLTGLLDAQDRKAAAAVRHLERAIALDPEIEHAYQMAAEQYGKLGRQADKERIADAYRSKFGRDLR